MRSLAVLFLPLLLATMLVCVSAGAADMSLPLPEGRRARELVESGVDYSLYWRVARFALRLYCLSHDIKPERKLVRVVSGRTQPAGGVSVDYILVLDAEGLGRCRALVRGVPAEGSHDWKLHYFGPAN